MHLSPPQPPAWQTCPRAPLWAAPVYGGKPKSSTSTPTSGYILAFLLYEVHWRAAAAEHSSPFPPLCDMHREASLAEASSKLLGAHASRQKCSFYVHGTVTLLQRESPGVRTLIILPICAYTRMLDRAMARASMFLSIHAQHFIAEWMPCRWRTFEGTCRAGCAS